MVGLTQLLCIGSGKCSDGPARCTFSSGGFLCVFSTIGRSSGSSAPSTWPRPSAPAITLLFVLLSTPPRLLERSPRIARSPCLPRQRPPVPSGSPLAPGLSGGGSAGGFLAAPRYVIGSGFALAAGPPPPSSSGAGSAAYASVGSGARQSGHQGYTPYIAPLFRQQLRSAVQPSQRQRALGAPVHPVH